MRAPDRSLHPFALLAVVLSSLALSAMADPDVAGEARRVYRAEYPEGPGKSLADRNCLMCHSATLVTQQAKDSTGWEKSLTQMETWGVRLTPDERDSLRAYLIAQFPPKR